MIRWVRRVVQLVFLAGFCALFVQTRYVVGLMGRSHPLPSPVPVDAFLNADPLIALTALIGARELIPHVLVWAAPVVLLTLALGRVWCGWICPLGTVLDGSARVLKGKGARRASEPPARLYRIKYYLLVALLVTTLFSAQLVYLLDPIALITRTFTLVLTAPAQLGLVHLSSRFPDAFGGIVASPLFFRMNLVVFIIFVALVGGEWISRRFWCRNLCPLGALLGVISKVSPFRRRVSATCRDCGRCRHECKMAAIPAEPRQTLNPECIECYSCVAVCPAKAVAIAPGRAADQQAPGLDLSRRRLLGAAGIGLAWAGIAHTGASAKFVLSPRGGEIRGTTRHLIRPPGALPEDEFLARCIRCGECMKVCPMNALQPALSEGGIEGFWSPVVVPRIGYCMQPCNLCGAVCPTGAIQRFEIEDKPNTFIGTATINRNTCLAWYAEKTCLVCNEACSYQAIPIQVIDGFKRPLIDETKCVGCGECENKCPIQPDAAITVSSLGERRQRMLEPGGH